MIATLHDDDDTTAATHPGALSITFDGEARNVFETLLRAIPHGYTVALLGEGQQVPSAPAVVPDIDVTIVAIDATGVAYRNLTPVDAEPTGPIKIKKWEDIDRVHVY
jgi:hypothetical protein